jgi:hypothetical protein
MGFPAATLNKRIKKKKSGKNLIYKLQHTGSRVEGAL